MASPRRSPRFAAKLQDQLQDEIHQLQDEIHQLEMSLEDKKRALDCARRQELYPILSKYHQLILDFCHGKPVTNHFRFRGSYQRIDLSAADNGQFGGYPVVHTFMFDISSQDSSNFYPRCELKILLDSLTPTGFAECKNWSFTRFDNNAVLEAEIPSIVDGYKLVTKFTLIMYNISEL